MKQTKKGISCTKNMVTPVQGPGKEAPHTLAISENGTVYVWGAGQKGKMGNLKEKWGFHLKGKEDSNIPYPIGNIAKDSVFVGSVFFFLQLCFISVSMTIIHRTQQKYKA